jgi:hypothetical protein
MGVRSLAGNDAARSSETGRPGRRPVALPTAAVVSTSTLHRGGYAFDVITSLQRTAGNQAVQRLVRLTSPPAAPKVLTAAERRAFVRSVFPAGRQRSVGLTIIEDMARTSDFLEFQSPLELSSELRKRVTMSMLMESSQSSSGGLTAFGYPFTGRSLYWGPRVNAAAKDYWVPPVGDNYDLRRDPAKRAEIRRLPRGERHRVFGDPPGLYEFGLSATGRADPWNAIMLLFTMQPPHKRSLIHCDYLISLVTFRAFMGTLGRTAFNARIAAYGPDRIKLRWNLFAELEPTTVAGPGLGSIRQVVPANPADLVIGDHVYFWNHAAYDVINDNVGNAWRLENAVLVSRKSGEDIFLGHGSGHKTSRQMRAKLAEEYNDVARIALRLVQKTRRGPAAARAAARTELSTRFHVVLVAGKWRIQGTGLRGVHVDDELKLLRASDIPGLQDPADTTRMYPVRRPIESAP